MSSVTHLTRRFRGSLSREEPAAGDVEWAQRLLLPREASLWNSMAVQDRRHSIEVARRFLVVAPEATPAEMAGALLHDVGKTVSGLGTFSRVLATVVGPHTERFRQYRDHEAIGAELLREAGSDPVTVELVQGRGPHAESLRRADEV